MDDPEKWSEKSKQHDVISFLFSNLRSDVRDYVSEGII